MKSNTKKECMDDTAELQDSTMMMSMKGLTSRRRRFRTTARAKATAVAAVYTIVDDSTLRSRNDFKKGSTSGRAGSFARLFAPRKKRQLHGENSSQDIKSPDATATAKSDDTADSRLGKSRDERADDVISSQILDAMVAPEETQAVGAVENDVSTTSPRDEQLFVPSMDETTLFGLKLVSSSCTRSVFAVETSESIVCSINDNELVIIDKSSSSASDIAATVASKPRVDQMQQAENTAIPKLSPSSGSYEEKPTKDLTFISERSAARVATSTNEIKTTDGAVSSLLSFLLAGVEQVANDAGDEPSQPQSQQKDVDLLTANHVSNPIVEMNSLTNIAQESSTTTAASTSHALHTKSNVASSSSSSSSSKRRNALKRITSNLVVHKNSQKKRVTAKNAGGGKPSSIMTWPMTRKTINITSRLPRKQSNLGPGGNSETSKAVSTVTSTIEPVVVVAAASSLVPSDNVKTEQLPIVDDMPSCTDETENKVHDNDKQERATLDAAGSSLKEESRIEKDDLHHTVENEDNHGRYYVRHDVTILLASQLDGIEAVLANDENLYASRGGPDKENDNEVGNVEKETIIIGCDSIETTIIAEQAKGVDTVGGALIVKQDVSMRTMPTYSNKVESANTDDQSMVKMEAETVIFGISDTSPASNAPKEDAMHNVPSPKQQGSSLNVVVEASPLTMQEMVFVSATPELQVLLQPILQTDSQSYTKDKSKVNVLLFENESDKDSSKKEPTTPEVTESTNRKENKEVPVVAVEETACRAIEQQNAIENASHKDDIAIFDIENRRTDDDSNTGSKSPLPAKPHQLDGRVCIATANNESGAYNFSKSEVVETLKEAAELVEKGNYILLEPILLCSLIDKVEQRQEDVYSSHSRDNDKDGETSSRHDYYVSSLYRGGFVMKSDLLQGNVMLEQSKSNISSISVGSNGQELTNQRQPPPCDEHDNNRPCPYSLRNGDGDVDDESLDSMEEIILNVTREYVDIYTLINRERSAQGLEELQRCRYLDSLATSHANLIAELGMLGHSVDSLSALQEQLNSRLVGENVQCGENETEMHMTAMQAGTSSRNNIVRPSYKQFGVGTATSPEDGMLYMVQLFRGPRTREMAEMDTAELNCALSSIWCTGLWCWANVQG
jgi:hypothetical protein